MWMSRHALLRSLDTSQVESALRAAEQRTSGEIRVSVSRVFWGDVRRTAERAFVRLGMTQTQERNGVLFFIVPARRKFAVLGDEGIHAKVGQDFWDRIAHAMSEHFHAEKFTEGLVRGIEVVGNELAAHFPHRGPRDVNELPDHVDFR